MPTVSPGPRRREGEPRLADSSHSLMHTSRRAQAPTDYPLTRGKRYYATHNVR